MKFYSCCLFYEYKYHELSYNIILPNYNEFNIIFLYERFLSVDSYENRFDHQGRCFFMLWNIILAKLFTGLTELFKYLYCSSDIVSSNTVLTFC